LAYSKEKNEPPHYYTHNERRKKTRLKKRRFFCEIAILFSSLFFARRSFLAQLNALFKNIKKIPQSSSLQIIWRLKRCGSVWPLPHFLGKNGSSYFTKFLWKKLINFFLVITKISWNQTAAGRNPNKKIEFSLHHPALT